MMRYYSYAPYRLKTRIAIFFSSGFQERWNRIEKLATIVSVLCHHFVMPSCIVLVLRPNLAILKYCYSLMLLRFLCCIVMCPLVRSCGTMGPYFHMHI